MREEQNPHFWGREGQNPHFWGGGRGRTHTSSGEGGAAPTILERGWVQKWASVLHETLFSVFSHIKMFLELQMKSGVGGAGGVRACWPLF